MSRSLVTPMQHLKPHGSVCSHVASPAFGVARYSVGCLADGPCIIQIISMDGLQISEQNLVLLSSRVARIYVIVSDRQVSYTKEGLR